MPEIYFGFGASNEILNLPVLENGKLDAKGLFRLSELVGGFQDFPQEIKFGQIKDKKRQVVPGYTPDKLAKALTSWSELASQKGVILSGNRSEIELAALEAFDYMILNEPGTLALSGQLNIRIRELKFKITGDEKYRNIKSETRPSNEIINNTKAKTKEIKAPRNKKAVEKYLLRKHENRMTLVSVLSDLRNIGKTIIKRPYLLFPVLLTACGLNQPVTITPEITLPPTGQTETFTPSPTFEPTATNIPIPDTLVNEIGTPTAIHEFSGDPTSLTRMFTAIETQFGFRPQNGDLAGFTVEGTTGQGNYFVIQDRENGIFYTAFARVNAGRYSCVKLEGTDATTDFVFFKLTSVNRGNIVDWGISDGVGGMTTMIEYQLDGNNNITSASFIEPKSQVGLPLLDNDLFSSQQLLMKDTKIVEGLGLGRETYDQPYDVYLPDNVTPETLSAAIAPIVEALNRQTAGLTQSEIAKFNPPGEVLGNANAGYNVEISFAFDQIPLLMNNSARITMHTPDGKNIDFLLVRISRWDMDYGINLLLTSDTQTQDNLTTLLSQMPGLSDQGKISFVQFDVVVPTVDKTMQPVSACQDQAEPVVCVFGSNPHDITDSAYPLRVFLAAEAQYNLEAVIQVFADDFGNGQGVLVANRIQIKTRR